MSATSIGQREGTRHATTSLELLQFSLVPPPPVQEIRFLVLRNTVTLPSLVPSAVPSYLPPKQLPFPIAAESKNQRLRVIRGPPPPPPPLIVVAIAGEGADPAVPGLELERSKKPQAGEIMRGDGPMTRRDCGLMQNVAWRLGSSVGVGWERVGEDTGRHGVHEIQIPIDA